MHTHQLSRQKQYLLPRCMLATGQFTCNLKIGKLIEIKQDAAAVLYVQYCCEYNDVTTKLCEQGLEYIANAF